MKPFLPIITLAPDLLLYLCRFTLPERLLEHLRHVHHPLLRPSSARSAVSAVQAFDFHAQRSTLYAQRFGKSSCPPLYAKLSLLSLTHLPKERKNIFTWPLIIHQALGGTFPPILLSPKPVVYNTVTVELFTMEQANEPI